MIGAIVGDIVGSIYEFNNIRTKDFPFFSPNCFFTDDTVLTVAVAEVILSNGNYIERFKDYFRRYRHAGFGARFYQWAASDQTEPYNSLGNGSAMRVSPVGFAFQDLDTVLLEASRTAEVTHNHPEGIRGAQATAAAIFLARTGATQEQIKSYLEQNFNYDLSQTVAQIRATYEYTESCPKTMPPALVAFLESTDFEDAIRNAISIGGDSDTIACITGGIAEAFYGVPDAIAQQTLRYLDEPLRKITLEFMAKYKT